MMHVEDVYITVLNESIPSMYCPFLNSKCKGDSCMMFVALHGTEDGKDLGIVGGRCGLVFKERSVNNLC